MSETGSNFCGNCGMNLVVGQQFCIGCGAKSSPVSPQPAGPTRKSRFRGILGVAIGLGCALAVLLAAIGWTEIRNRDSNNASQTVAILRTVPTDVPSQPIPASQPPQQSEQPPPTQPPIAAQPSTVPIAKPVDTVHAKATSVQAKVAFSTPKPASTSPNTIPDPPPLPSTPTPPNSSDTSRPTLPASELPNTAPTSTTQVPLQQTEQPTQQPAVTRHTPSTYSGPSSGVITWSGAIDKNGSITIEGDHASSGTLNGKLPAVPVIVNIDTKEFALAEVPSPTNGWNRMVIRSRNKRQIAISISWRLP